MKINALKFLLIITCIIAFTNCSEDDTSRKQPLRFAPQNAEVILNINVADSFLQHYKANPTLNALTDNHKKTLFKGLDLLDSLTHLESAHIIFSEIEAFNHTTLISPLSSEFEDKNVYTGTIDYKNVSYKTAKNRFSAIIDSIYITSSSENVLQQIIEQHQSNSHFNIEATEKLLSISNSDVSVLVTPKSKHHFAIFPESYNSLFKDWLLFDVKLDTDALILNGTILETVKDSLPQLNTSSFNNYELAPVNSDAFSSYVYNDAKAFRKIHLKDTDTIPYLAEAEELSFITLKNNTLVFLKLYDRDQTDLSGIDINSEYRGYTIYDLPHAIHLKNKTSKGNVAFLIDNYLAFGNNLDVIHEFIQEYSNNNLLGDNNDFNYVLELLNSQAHQLDIHSTASFIQKKALNTYPFITHQLIHENGFTQVTTVLSKIAKQQQGGISEIASIQLDNHFITTPQFVLNHRNGKSEIIIQDEDFNLYLITLAGKVLWKKKLDSKILGDIKQVDIYKNRKLQYAFCTKNNMYIIDRNGNDVENFPVTFKDDITQPLNVFDYDKNKKYRFTIVQNGDLFVLDNKGKRVRGFDYSKDGNITTIPKHYRIKTKDYIVFNTNSSIKIIDRTGKSRITVKEPILSDDTLNTIFVYKGNFVYADNNGVFYSISTSGNINKETTLFTKPSVGYGNNTKAILSENKLLINDKTVELPFGSYAPIKVFTAHNIDYIHTTNLETDKLYLFQSSGELIKNFPVFGASSADMTFNKRQKLLCVLGNENTIIVYNTN